MSTVVKDLYFNKDEGVACIFVRDNDYLYDSTVVTCIMDESSFKGIELDSSIWWSPSEVFIQMFGTSIEGRFKKVGYTYDGKNWNQKKIEFLRKSNA